MKFTQIPAETFSELQLNAGVLMTEFSTSDPKMDRSKIIGATSGGVTFEASPTFEDFGDDIDNCPKNMKELKRLTSVEAKMSGTFVTLTPKIVASTIGAADVDPADATHIVPRNDLSQDDFSDLWWVGDYSDKNGKTNGGFCAIHMMNTLSTGGFKLKADDDKKGTFDFEYTAHYTMSDPDTVPYEVYVKAGTAEPTTASTSGTTETTGA